MPDIRAGRGFIEFFVEDKEARRQLKQFEANLKTTANSITAVGAGLAGIGAVGIAGIVASVRSFSTLETSLSRVGTLLGDNIDELGTYQTQIQSLSQEFGQPASELADGLFNITSAGIDAASSIDVLEASTKAAIAGATDLSTATSLITTTLNAFGKSGEDSEEVFDQLFATARLGQTDFDSLGSQFGRVAGIAAQSGTSISELGAAYVVLTKQTGSTELATTRINAVLNSLIKPSGEAQTALANLNEQLRESGQSQVDFSLAGVQANGLLETFQQLDGIPQDVLIKLFGGQEALSAALTLTERADDFALANAEIANSAGETNDAYAQFADDVAQRTNVLAESFNVLKQTVGAVFAGPFTTALDILIDVTQGITEFVKENEGLVKTVGAGAAVLVAAGGSLVAFGASISGLIAVLNIAGTAATAITGLGASTGALSLAFTAFTAAAGPLLPIIAGVAIAATAAAAAYALWNGTLDESEKALQRQRAAQDSRSDSTERALETIEKLNEKEKLTTSESLRLSSAIDTVKNTLPDFRLEVDETTGRVLNLADAFALLNERQAEQRFERASNDIQNNRADVNEATEQVNEIRQQISELEQLSGTFVDTTVRVFGGLGGSTELNITSDAQEQDNEDQLSRLRDQFAERDDILIEASARLNRTQAVLDRFSDDGGNFQFTDEDAEQAIADRVAANSIITEEEKARLDETRRIGDASAALEKRFADAEKTQFELRLQEIEEFGERRKQALQAIIDDQLSLPEDQRDTLLIDVTTERLDNVDQQTFDSGEALQQSRDENLEAENKALLEEQSLANQRLEIQLNKEGFEQKLALLALDEQSALAAAERNEREADYIDRLKESFRLRRQILAEAEKERAESELRRTISEQQITQTTNNQGAIAAGAIAGLSGLNTSQKRIEDLTKDQTDTLNRTLKAIDRSVQDINVSGGSGPATFN